MAGNGIGDTEKLRVALDRDVFVIGIFGGKFLAHDGHVEREHCHPAGRIRLFERETGRQRLRTVVNRNVVEAEEAALEEVIALAVDLVHPVGEVDKELVEAALQPRAIGGAAADAVHVVDAPDRPGVHRRVEVGELPLIGGNLTVGMEELLEQLRALEHGYRIRVVRVPHRSIGVDTPADLEVVRRLCGA